MLTIKAKLEELKAQKAANLQDIEKREENIANAHYEFSDASLSNFADRANAELLDAKIEILENGGKWFFEELQYLDGTPVPNAKLCNTKYGQSYRVEHEDGQVEWVNRNVKEKTLANKGYKLGEVEKLAWCKLVGNEIFNMSVIYFPINESMFAEESEEVEVTEEANQTIELNGEVSEQAEVTTTENNNNGQNTFFEAGKTYLVYLKTGGIRKFKCTSSDKDSLIVRGSYENGKEKAYKAMPAWGRLMDKQEGRPPSSYVIKINNRNGFVCGSKDLDKGVVENEI